MQKFLARTAVSCFSLYAFVLSPLIIAQQPMREESRPRRIRETTPTSGSTPAAPQIWTAPTAASVTASTVSTSAIQEPMVRVALATSVRGGSISTTGRLLSTNGTSAAMLPLDVARVRVEPRLLSPLSSAPPPDAYGLRVDGFSSRNEADEKAREVQTVSGDDAKAAFDVDTKSWILLLEGKRSREEAEELRARLEDAGFDAALVYPSSRIGEIGNTSAIARGSTSSPASNSPTNTQFTARPMPATREVLALTPGAATLFRSSAPVTFASDNESESPVRFNDRPYRGRIEVFTNLRGTLTVVNVLGLEDYVRGVVANELSPGGYPALEALKAQAIAARTYALKNLGQFRFQGFDLLPTTRSQVYRGLSSEHPLSTRAVNETRGLVATFAGEPINAVYTSTCGGRTENSENIFNEAVPYLRSRECAAQGNPGSSFSLATTRDASEVREEQHLALTRDVALLTVHDFAMLRTRLTDSWLAAEATVNEVRSWLASIARLAHQIAPTVTEEVNRPGPFATALNAAVFGEGRADTILNSADVEYFLAIRDAGELPASNRADVALLLRDGYLSVFPDATLRPRESMSRARVLHTITRLLEARSLLQIQKGTARPSSQVGLILRGKGKDQVLKVSQSAFLMRQIGEQIYPVRSVALVGGEAVAYHLSLAGDVDYLEVKPAPNGAAAERFSPFTNWTSRWSIGQVQARLGRYAKGIGSITDLRVAARGASRRVIDLELVGSNGSSHVRGGRIRSALGLREQLFVIDRQYDDSGRVTGFLISGRGWGHGVGLCQVGAYGMAKQGLNYEQILKAYYTGVDISRLY